MDSLITDAARATCHEIFDEEAVPRALRADHDTMSELAKAYKAINAPRGELARKMLEISTQALAGNDATYAALEPRIGDITNRRSLAFASTNIDNTLVLVAFFADPRYPPRKIVLGQYLGMTGLISASIVAALLAAAVPVRYVGLCGLIPIGMGIAQLWSGVPQGSPALAVGANRPPSILEVALVTVSNGGDNLGTYIPLFAGETAKIVMSIAVLFLLLNALACASAFWLVRHPTMGAPLRRNGARMLPWLLIGLGIYILARTGLLSH